MVKRLLFFGLLLVFSIYSCKKDKIEPKVIISYKLYDDVSPVKVKFWTNHSLQYAKWEIDSITKELFDADTLELVFEKDDTLRVKLTAEGTHNEEYNGDTVIIIPKVATKLKISGAYFKDNVDLGIQDDTITFRLNYYDGNSYHNNAIVVPTIDFVNNDSILFKNAVVFNISGFEQTQGDSLFVYYIIEGQDSTGVHQYYKSMFYVKDWYYNHRMYAPNYIYLDNILGTNNERMYLKSDWYR